MDIIFAFFSFGFFVFIFFVLAVLLAIKGVKIIPQADLWVIERLGSYRLTLSGGIHYIVPFIDSIRAQYNTQEQDLEVPQQKVITKDNVSIMIDGIVFIRVIDAKEAVYGVLNMKNAISQLAQTTLRSEIGKMDLDETLSSREQLNSALLTALDSAASQWGVKITRVEISDIDVPEEVRAAMELQLRAERERRATVTQAEGQKKSTIEVSEGEKIRVFNESEAAERMSDAKKYEQVQLAEGQKRAMELINEAMRENPQAAEFLLAKDRIKAFSDLASNTTQDKIVVPYDAVSLVGGLTTLVETLSKRKQ